MKPAWNPLDTPESIHSFLQTYGYFHDACLVNLRYLSGASVDPDTLDMQPCAIHRRIVLSFQRQYHDPFCIEMRFDGLENLTLRPVDPNYTCELHQARLRLHNNKIEWFSDHIDDEYNQYHSPHVTWLRAERGWWRPLS